MKCKKCGTEAQATDKFCVKCGAPLVEKNGNSNDVQGKEYKYKTTGLIAGEMQSHRVDFKVSIENDGSELIQVPFGSGDGAIIAVNYFINDDSNGIAIASVILTSILIDKRSRILDFCNKMNARYRFVKFFILEDSCVVRYDFLDSCSNDCVGKMAFEYFLRIMDIIKTERPNFLRIVYSEGVTAIKNQDNGILS